MVKRNKATPDLLNKLASLFGVSVDDILNLSKEVTVEDKTTMELLQLIQQLDDDDKHVIFRMIDPMLPNKNFKDFFSKNIAAL